ncbi:hypothetical protein SteCoe_13945 [Stentor coeruleus]|uniref:Uncharacterized protein n=1 Tax=Stentor coeruleus TaxID=5963 RepID=A0A1R2C788_9CILI|nr:hypothetical protein SteCoe_13945 [Stentor coeruleus]
MDKNYSDSDLDLEINIDENPPTTIYEDYTTTYNCTLETINPQAPDAPRPKRPRGRKAKKSQIEIDTLQPFIRGSGYPKKEYVRCKIIRGQKRAIRHALKNNIPTKTIHKVNKENEDEINAWDVFAKHTIDNSEFFKEISKTEKGPKTDGAARRDSNCISCDIQKSFNDVFCAQYFNNDLVVENYKFYLDVIFSYMVPENLINRFDFSCCKLGNSKHSSVCLLKWENLRNYLKEGMLKDLMWNPENFIPVEAVEILDFYEIIDE